MFALRDLRLAGIVAFGILSALALCACASRQAAPPVEAVPPPVPELPSQYRPEDFVGRWGYGTYHREGDQARTEKQAHGQCGQPVVINRGPNGGVMMYLADSAQLQELRLKGSPSGKNFVGPPGPPGGTQDREIVSLDGRVMVLRWVDPEINGRYGTGVYVRCGTEGVARSGKPAAR